MNQMLKDFRAFVMRGNAVVTSLVNDVIMEIIAAIVGKPAELQLPHVHAR